MRRALVLAAVTAAASGCGGASSHRAAPTTVAAKRPHPVRRAPPRPPRLVERPAGSLPAPVQDAAYAVVGGKIVLAGGLDAADVSTATILVGGAARGRLPVALHDAAAATIGRDVYVFGGGDGVRQLDAVVRVDPATGAATTVGRLPSPRSDVTAAAVGGTAYVFGGYDGTRWLDDVVAFRPGRAPRVVAHLPQPLRYAAAAAAGGRVVVAGGSTPAGTASADVLLFDPRARTVRRIGRLARPTTHAAAASLGRLVYVVGGRGATPDTPTTQIYAIDPATRRIRPSGQLSVARSDLAAVTVGGRIRVAGGRAAGATTSAAGVLVVQRVTHGARAVAQTDNVYAADSPRNLQGATRAARPLVYVPNSDSDTLDEIDPRTGRIVRHVAVGGLPQHVVPAWDLKTLYVTNDTGNSLTAIDPRTGAVERTIPVDDPYNMYFTPDGRYAIVVAERLARLDFRDAHTFALHRSVPVPCRGVDHMDFTADRVLALVTCEFSGQLLVVNVPQERVLRTIDLHGGMPQDVKLSPDGRVFWVADMAANGVWEVDARTFRVLTLLRTGRGTHGLYPSRDDRFLYATNRGEGTVSVISFRTRRIVRTFHIPGGSPDMGNVSADGRTLWLSGRWNAEVYAIDTRTGAVRARIRVGRSPHGLCVWPQPGRYSLGHTGILR